MVTQRVATALLRLSNNPVARETLCRSSMSAVALCRALVEGIEDECEQGPGEEVVGAEDQTRGQFVSRVTVSTSIIMANLAAEAFRLERAGAAGGGSGTTPSLGKYGLVGVATALAARVTKGLRGGGGGKPSDAKALQALWVPVPQPEEVCVCGAPPLRVGWWFAR
jgi:hypothetical protein